MRSTATRGREDRLLRVLGAVLACAVPAVLLVAALAPELARDAIAEGGIACPFRALTGLPCPFCNITHAVVALGSGDVAGAHAHHPLVIPVLALWVLACARLGRGQPTGVRFAVVLVAVAWMANLASS